MSEVREVAIGEYAEHLPWEVITPYESEQTQRDELCPHAMLLGTGELKGWIRYRLPFAIKARNEGGFNCTILCGECVREALK